MQGVERMERAMPDVFGPESVTVVGILLSASMAVILLTLSMRVFLPLRASNAAAHRQSIQRPTIRQRLAGKARRVCAMAGVSRMASSLRT
ncbi:hypothetical protein [Azospirillum canadense]|uniref:hypothetical protein n=1 Tax=Azospirillum canadense TaxID=403962 RepID=UPI002225FFBA|nr:hypothetical protein [Azospirillum canadense]MCW2241389.1 hypothetical protein [Azospirillum canadense]